MHAPDSIRAQYFLELVERFGSRIQESLNRAGCPPGPTEAIIGGLQTSLARELDNTVLAAAIEIVTAGREAGTLRGETPEQRYESAFHREREWTPDARSLPVRYPILFSQMATQARQATEHVVTCIAALQQTEVRNFSPRSLVGVDFLAADRHAAAAPPLRLIFESGDSWVYKSGDHLYFRTVDAVFEALGASSANVALPEVKLFDDFALVEYVDAAPPQTLDDARSYYKTFGATIAFFDAINFCDGHFENVIPTRTRPVVIDVETAFHAFGEFRGDDDERSILNTGLIQKRDAEGGISSALQTPAGLVHELGRPFAVEDRTDRIELRYRGLIKHSSKRKSSRAFLVQDHVDDVFSGYSTAFELICSRKGKALRNTSLWNDVSKTRFRQVVRATLYYVHLLRRLQMPDVAEQTDGTLKWLEQRLNAIPTIAPYEAYELAQGRVPIFHHYGSSRDIIDGFGGVVPGFLKQSAVSEVRTQWASMDASYGSRQLDILRNQLTARVAFKTSSNELRQDNASVTQRT